MNFLDSMGNAGFCYAPSTPGVVHIDARLQKPYKKSQGDKSGDQKNYRGYSGNSKKMFKKKEVMLPHILQEQYNYAQL